MWSCRGGEALECIWPLKELFIQGCAGVRSCFPKGIGGHQHSEIGSQLAFSGSPL
ncbi:hypothetical protein Nmel_006216, partial [Mimus melanotis]